MLSILKLYNYYYRRKTLLLQCHRPLNKYLPKTNRRTSLYSIMFINFTPAFFLFEDKTLCVVVLFI